MEFKELELVPQLQENLAKANFLTLTKIQEQAIPFALTGKDITGLAQTGTGKTLAFLVPSINQLIAKNVETGKTYILALAPTRELVMQIAEEATKLLKGTPYAVATIIGGTDYKGQEDSLSNNPGIIVATPGRLIDFVKTRNLDITQVGIVIIDEADRMFDMGFVNDLKYVFHKCKDRSQTMLFSATLSFEIIRLAYKYLTDPVEVQVDPDRIISERIEQSLYHLGRDEKLSYLVNLILNDSMDELGIIFTNYKSNIPLIIRTLHRYGIATAGLSSDFDQKKRIRLLKDFKLGKYKFMVATDVASRGIDVANIDIVYNYDLPSDSENYVHRIGRTARAGKKGRSISFCSESDYQELERIEKYLKGGIPVGEVNEDYLKMPKGEFEAFIPEDPAILKSLQDSKGSYSKSDSQSRGRSGSRTGAKPGSTYRSDKGKSFERNGTASPDAKPKKPRDSKFPRKDKKEFTSAKPSFHKSPKPGKTEFQPRADKSKRNLFDIDEVRNKNEKKSLWKKVKSVFGF
ncbi:MAG: DEAD/DEAH box helicase [Leptospira sp.]|nr:DEAD/DEAH box helicase [Leptospira sp.]